MINLKGFVELDIKLYQKKKKELDIKNNKEKNGVLFKCLFVTIIV